MAPLSPKGFANLPALNEKLRRLNIGTIYSSPFLRTLQTVYTFAIEQRLKIHVEYALYEHYNIPKKYTKYSVYRLLVEYPHLFDAIEPCYQSFFNYALLNLNETNPEKNYRIQSFMHSLIYSIVAPVGKRPNPTQNILIVTHRDVIDTLMNINVQPGDIVQYYP
tara:strand:+ start:45 stop:536 length:492 start_codon:yes stop_codon:yes gene_type:complete